MLIPPIVLLLTTTLDVELPLGVINGVIVILWDGEFDEHVRVEHVHNMRNMATSIMRGGFILT